MLILAGLGLNEKSLTLEELEEAKKCEELYVETYTNLWEGNIENIEKIVGKKIEIVGRKELEESSDKIVERAKEKNIIIFVPGDPLVATTHASLIVEAIKRNVKYKVLHNASIISSIFKAGIHPYKVGGIVTIPFRYRTSKKPISVFKIIKRNLKNKLHTICLLDIDLEKGEIMSLKDALNFLIQVGLKKKHKIIVASNIGTSKEKILFRSIEDLYNLQLEPPITIVVPGSLHFTEKEFLELLST